MFVWWNGVEICENATDGYSSESSYNTTVHARLEMEPRVRVTVAGAFPSRK